MATATDPNISPSLLAQLAAMGLGDYVGQSPKEMEDALYNRSAADIERQSGVNAQAALENTFGRGVGQAGGGPSSITSTALQPIEKARSDALAKARNDAFVAANQARLAALAQAAGTAQNAINSTNAQGNQQTALQLQKRGQNFQQGQATTQAVGSGIGGLGGAALSTAGMLYAPEIKKGLRGLLDAGAGDKMPTSRLAELSGAGGNPAVEAMPTVAPLASTAADIMPAAYDFTSGIGSGGGGLGALSSYGLSPSSFEMPDINWADVWNVPTKLNFDWVD